MPFQQGDGPAAADTELLELGRQFEEIVTQMDMVTDRKLEDAALGGLLAKLELVEPAIVAFPATTIDGLRVKARAAAWALLGDLDPTGGSTTDERMSMSIVRDVIRLYDPEREDEGALTRLVEEIESGAALSSDNH